jgi:hypothetical protein
MGREYYVISIQLERELRIENYQNQEEQQSKIHHSIIRVNSSVPRQMRFYDTFLILQYHRTITSNRMVKKIVEAFLIFNRKEFQYKVDSEEMF